MERVDEQQPPTVVTSDTDNATQIRPDEAPPDKRTKAKVFKAYNTGLWNGPRRENTEAFRRQDDLHRYDALASSLDLTDFQKQRGRKVMDDLDFHEMGKPIDHIIFGVCCAVANDDVEGGTRYWPHPDATGDARFEDVADNLGLTQRQQLSAVQQVKARTRL